MVTAATASVMGRYELKRVLGKGSQGKVYLAYDPQLERDVAIKILTSSLAEFNLKGANGTPLEALTSSRLKHPNIVPIYDIGEAQLGPYLVFGYVPGRTLANELGSRQKFTLKEAAGLITTVLDAVATAHEAGVLHLDLGPRNIMMDERGKPQVMDFGLSQFVDFQRDDLGLATGTLRYMAPEHFLRQELGPYTDVFALASTIYELLTGQRAIPGDSIESIQRNIVGVAVNYAPLNDIEDGEHIVRFLKGAFVMDIEDRYENARAMLEAFKVCVVAAGVADEARGTDLSHSTVDFLMRRMQHKKDFPAISSTLNDINRLAGDSNGNANADKLANVILRDLSLTSKLLTMANSSFYGSRATEVTSVSQAVVLLGVQQVRMVASSLTLFGHLKGDSDVLRDSMTKSFLSGLIARHLAQRAKLRDAEEAFIAGMCQNLGENLTIYYFPEEHDVILETARSKSLPRWKAAVDVLGCDFAMLGANVAKVWSLPQVIIEAIMGISDGDSMAPADDQQAIRNLSVMANELCAAFVDADRDEVSDVLDVIAARYAQTTELSSEYLYKLFAAAYEKLSKFAPIFEINVNSSEFCSAVQQWIALRERELAA
ncbi:MAG: HDOD domain-containing protein [Pseudomonadota bacterium]